MSNRFLKDIQPENRIDKIRIKRKGDPILGGLLSIDQSAFPTANDSTLDLAMTLAYALENSSFDDRYNAIDAFQLKGAIYVPYTPSSIDTGDEDALKTQIINNGETVGYFLGDKLYANVSDINGDPISGDNVNVIRMPFLSTDQINEVEFLHKNNSLLNFSGDGKVEIYDKSYNLIKHFNTPNIPNQNTGYEIFAPDGTLLIRAGSENKEENFVLGLEISENDNSNENDIEYYDSTRFPSWVYDGKNTHQIDENGVLATIDIQSYSHQAISNNVCVCIVGDKQVALNRDGLLYPNPNKILLIIPSFGQSLSVGSGGMPIYTTEDKNPHPKKLLKFKDYAMNFNRTGGSGIIKVIEADELKDFGAMHASDFGNNYSGETFAEQMIIQLTNKIDKDGAVRFLSFAAGCGGTLIADLQRGSNSYTTLINAVTAAKKIAKEKGWTIKMPAICWQHGESGSGDIEYKNKLVVLRDQINEDIKLITKQVEDVHMYFANPSTATNVNAYQSSQAMYELARDEPDKYTQVGGTYECQPYKDFTHLTTRGYVLLGNKYADAIYYEMKNGVGSYNPVSPKKIVRTNNIIDINFNVPIKPLKFMTNDVIYTIENQGFSYTDSSNSASIVSVKILSDGETVRITLNQTPIGTNKYIRAGWNGSSKSYAGRQRTNLCDSSNGKTIFGDDTNHFCVTFEEIIE